MSALPFAVSITSMSTRTSRSNSRVRLIAQVTTCLLITLEHSVAKESFFKSKKVLEF